MKSGGGDAQGAGRPLDGLSGVRDALRGFAREREWDQFHTPRNLALAMVGEVGEVAECFQWRADAECAEGLPAWTLDDRNALGEELADVLMYLVRLADKCDIDLADAVERKLAVNARKYPTAGPHSVVGSRAKYSELREMGRGEGQGEDGG